MSLFLAHNGPALLDVKTSPYELAMPPKVKASQIAGMGLYAAWAVMKGRFREVRNLFVDNFIR